MNDARAVILAAGSSSRVGRQKLLMNFRGRPLIEYAIDAAQRRQPVVVAGPLVAEYLARRPEIELLRNDEPERGMSHSFALANRLVAGETAVVVLLGDKPLVTGALVDAICSAARGADVVYPVREGQPGHPVWLSPRARLRMDALPSGDSLRSIRDDPALIVRAVETGDPGAFFDVDTMDALSL
jgi:molybdenum cofactor cytidylyltransferase